MKRKLFSSLLTVILFFGFCNGQTGRLIPDTVNVRVDTTYAKGILYWDFSKGPITKVDSGYAITRTAPMVFLSTDGKRARTDQEQVISEKYYILPKRTEIEGRNIISFYAKPK